MNESEKSVVIEAVKSASERWKNAFNSGNAAECAAQYESDAVMQAEPFGTFEGVKNIQDFWENIMEEGFSDVEYIDPKIDVVDAQSAILKANWKMNEAKGIIHRELWVLQEDGSAKLREDHFEATG